jgi:ATP-binding cassette, subfamily B, bacterial
MGVVGIGWSFLVTREFMSTTVTQTSESVPLSRKAGLLWKFTAGRRWAIALSVLCLGGAVALPALSSVVVAAAIDGVLLGKTDANPAVFAALTALGVTANEPHSLWIAGVLLAVLAIATLALLYAKGHLLTSACEGLIRELRERVYAHIHHLPVAFFDKHATGDLVQRCTTDVETTRQFYLNQSVEIARAVLLLLIVLPLMFYYHWQLALLACALLPVITAYTLVFFRKAHATFKAVDEADGAMTAVLQENLTGIRVVRAFARQDFEAARFDTKNTAHRNLNEVFYKLLAFFWGISDLLCFIQELLVLVVGVYMVITGNLTVGTLVMFMLLVRQYLWPVRHSGRVVTDLGKAMVAVGRIDEILAHPTESEPIAPAPLPQHIQGRIDIDNLTLTLGGKTILQELSLTVEPGQTVALLGPSGAGKSSLINVLLRFYDYQHGSVKLDGVEINSARRDEVRKHFGVVMQEPFLFSKSLTENLRLGRPDAAADEVELVSRHAAVHDSIEGFEQKYNTIVGERGVTLSGGQRQRVALARALLRDAPILVLDDALSAVDTHTESLILDALRTRRHRQTTLLIAHRLSTVQHADVIIVMEHGRITQRGTHESLIGTPGLYQRLWNIQSALEEDLRAELGETPQLATT